MPVIMRADLGSPSWMGSREDLWGRWALECPHPQAAGTLWPTGNQLLTLSHHQARPVQFPPFPGSTKAFLFWVSRGDMSELSSR